MEQNYDIAGPSRAMDYQENPKKVHDESLNAKK